MEDGLLLNLDDGVTEVAQKSKLAWRDRLRLAREKEARRRNRRRDRNHNAGSGVYSSNAGIIVAAGPHAKRQQSNAAHQRHDQQQVNQGLGGRAEAHHKRPVAALHGYDDVLRGGGSSSSGQPQRVALARQPQPQQQQQQQQSARQKAAPPQKRTKLELGDDREMAATTRGVLDADEQADVLALVQLNMSHELQLEQEVLAEQQQQGRRRKSSAATQHERALQGVVEFGDAADEPEAASLEAHAAGSRAGSRAGRRAGSRAGQQHTPAAGAGVASGGGGQRSERMPHKQPKLLLPRQQQQQQQQQRETQQLLRRKTGEMLHAEPDVPAEQRQQLFGTPDDVALTGTLPSSWPGLGLCAPLAEHLTALNFLEPTQVQRNAIPLLLSGRDALVRSPTGSGKTLAYLAPIVHTLQSSVQCDQLLRTTWSPQAQQPRISRADGTHALILVPTRELAVQVSDVLTAIVRRFCWLVPGMLIGGEHRGHEKARLRKGVTLLVATPGRLLDHLQNTAAFRTGCLRWLVLDEADRLLDLGFQAKLEAILGVLHQHQQQQQQQQQVDGEGEGGLRQTVLTSATLHPGLAVLAGLSMKDPVAVGFSPAALEQAADGGGSSQLHDRGGPATAFELPKQLQQRWLEVHARMRLVALIGLLRSRLRRAVATKVVVFFSNCDSVDFHHALLPRLLPSAIGANSAAEGPPEGLLGDDVAVLRLHGDMAQPERTSSLLTFTKATRCVLLCTDVAARGLDFPAVSCILQYDPPGEAAEYVHRVGRTARMGQAGEALLLLLPSEKAYAGLLEAAGAPLQPARLGDALRCLPGAADSGSSAGGGSEAAVAQLARKLRRARAAGGDPASAGSDEQQQGLAEATPEQAAAALMLQRRLVGWVSGDEHLTKLATSAFRSFVRAYATHPSSLKHVFHVRNLHLGHVAASFGLRAAPGQIGASGATAERRARAKVKRTAIEQKEKRAWHRSARAAEAAGH